MRFDLFLFILALKGSCLVFVNYPAFIVSENSALLLPISLYVFNGCHWAIENGA